MKTRMYFVWDTSDKDPGCHYWMQFDSIEDAVSDLGDGIEVYVGELKKLGCFKRKVELVKVKQRKRRKK